MVQHKSLVQFSSSCVFTRNMWKMALQCSCDSDDGERLRSNLWLCRRVQASRVGGGIGCWKTASTEIVEITPGLWQNSMEKLGFWGGTGGGHALHFAAARVFH